MTLPVAPPFVDAGGIGSYVDAVTHAAALVALLVILAIAVLINAGPQLRTVRSALAQDVPRALTVGVAVQLAWLPALLLVAVLLSLTILGIVLVPFVAVAWVALTIGLAVLGIAGVAEMIGAATMRDTRRGLSERGVRLQALVIGLVILAAPALASAFLHAWPLGAGILRALAVGLLWVALTAGLGAVARTKAGTRQPDEPWGFKRPAPGGEVYVPPASPSDWVTPTPITGVVAAKRPVAAVRDR